jgi:uncharacterized membrane protein YphA (DoxX/SURF4 family)
MTDQQRRRLVTRKLQDLQVLGWLRRGAAIVVKFAAGHRHMYVCVVLGTLCSGLLVALGVASWFAVGVFVACLLAGLIIEIKAEWNRAGD